MRKMAVSLVIAIVLSLTSASATLASDQPIGRCPDGFELHPAMEHDDEHGHQHVGTEVDRNGDRWICVKHVGVDEDIHVHIDNDAALP